MNHLFESLKDKKIIIAGCNGYIGNAFAELLFSKNVKFTGIDKIDNVGAKPFSYNNFNLTNENELDKLISSVKPDIFFHFATHSALAYKNDFLKSFDEDYLSLKNIVKSLLKLRNTKLIYFSSSYVYSSLDSSEVVNEETVLRPKHNFGFGKSFFETMIQKTMNKYIIFRLSSVFGEGNYIHGNAIENLVKEAVSKKNIYIWGKGERKMQYVYIKDVINCLSQIELMPSGIYNLCSNDYDSINSTAKIIADYFNADTTNLIEKNEGETLPEMDNQKIKSIIGLDFFWDHSESMLDYLNNVKKVENE